MIATHLLITDQVCCLSILLHRVFQCLSHKRLLHQEQPSTWRSQPGKRNKNFHPARKLLLFPFEHFKIKFERTRVIRVLTSKHRRWNWLRNSLLFLHIRQQL